MDTSWPIAAQNGSADMEMIWPLKFMDKEKRMQCSH